MKQGRPSALVAYCIVLAAFILIGAGIGARDLHALSTVAPLTIADGVLAYLPLVVLTAGLVGMWFMRWWAIALFWLLVLVVTVSLLLVPFEGASEPFLLVLALNVAILIGVVALPPTFIAVTYRRRFR